MNDNPLDPMDTKLRELIHTALPPADTRLRRDLWHQMQARLDERERQRPGVRLRLKWWEMALVAGDLGAAFYAPEAIPALLYHI